MDVKLNNDKYRNEIVNCFAATNVLCHRFFKLFDEKLTEEELNARNLSTLRFKGDQSLLALLDLPFEFKGEVELTNDQQRILNHVDSRNYNLLMLAIECNNRDAIKTLLGFPIDLGHVGDESFWASDLCWEKQSWECLAELLEAGSPYPYNFDASFPSLATSIAFGIIKSTMEAATSFHESIQQGNIETVKLFIKNNRKLKQVYDSTNKSALTVALESNEVEIYSLLLSERFTPGVDDEYEEAFNDCNVKDSIRNKNREYFKNAFDEPHLVRLLNKYKLSFSSTNREACSQIIQKMFLKLNEIPEMVPILQIVSCSERLNIVFDFDCHSVREMDPVSTSSRGVTYRISGFIYVGAKNHREDFFNVIGTLAHELTHYAMELTYENNCNPYANNDKGNREIFKSIVDETQKLVQADPSTDSIIKKVFTCYKQEVWHQELIVGVPHLLANYKNAAETLKEARYKNYRLFDFFLSEVLPDVKAQTKVLMHKLEIRKINSLTGTIEKIKKYEIQLKELSPVELKDQIIGSNAPQLTLGMLRQSLDESFHVFINIEQISYGNMRERIGQLEKRDFAIVVDCTGKVKKHAETICNIKQIFSNSGKIFLVMTLEETSIFSLTLTNFRMTHAQHGWSDLTDDSQEALLQKNVNFQGNSIILNDIMTNKASVALRDLPLNEFCNTESFKIGDPLTDPFHKFYLPRSFITRAPKNGNNADQLESDADSVIAMNSNSRPQIEKRIFKTGLKSFEGLIESEKFETVSKTLNEILMESKEKTVVIISDSAGTGKTSTLHEIARKLRENDFTRWTILTDLKHHIKMFKKNQKSEKFKSFQDFVTEIILAGKSIFEMKLFEQFYEQGRANILLDGFDEISPHYKKEILKALKLFTPKSGNQLWITTRSHLELDLEKTLDQLSCSLLPLTREFQIKFLERVWKSDTKPNATNRQQNVSILAKDIITSLSSICDSNSSFIGLPILISMVAEIFHELWTQIEPLTFFTIFKQFVKKNIDKSTEKGEIAKIEQREILLLPESIVEVHHKIAIAHFFGNEITDLDVEYDDEQWTVEKLTRFGLIRYDGSKKSLSFIHETFAEYFLTDFIVANLRTKTKAFGAVKILVRVLTENDFQVVRLFLDQALKELNVIGNKKVCDIVGRQLNSIKDEALGVLLLISKESREEIFKFMLQTIEHVEEPILLINERDEAGNNALIINISFNRKTMIQSMFEFIVQNTQLEISKITVQALNDIKLNIFHFATINKNAEIVPTLHECLRKILTPEEIKRMLIAKTEDGYSILHYAAAKCNENALNEFVKIYKEIFPNEEMKERLFDGNKYGVNSLHVAAQQNNKISLICFFKLLKLTLNHNETKNLIQQRGFGHGTIFHSMCGNENEEILSTLYECMQKILPPEEIKRMFRAKDKNEYNVLQLGAALCKENALNDMMKIFTEVFSKEEIKEMLFEVNKEGNNSLHVAVHQNNKISLGCFFKHLNEILNYNETKNLIQQRGFGHGTIFHSACSNINEEIFQTLHECTIKFSKKHEMKKLLLLRKIYMIRAFFIMLH